ncbi:MAG: cobalt-precorrin-6A reductase [Geminicoccaceae bacterium]|nr:cobalt-precorrin-6A reductase [Geminicoccaceae bacterium]
MRRVLILGGTSEAVDLARALSNQPDLDVTTSLAGQTRRPRLPPGRVRIGGFGGATGLARHLEERRIDLLLDATHPFAIRISANAARASRLASVPLLVLARPRRPLPPDVIEVADLAAALAAVPKDARRALVTFRIDHLPLPAPDLELVVRAIEPPARPPPPGVRWLLARGPFRLKDERRLLERLRVDALIAKASGGGRIEPKLQAAEDLGRAVIVIARPPVPRGGTVVESVPDAVRWLDAQARGRST